MQLDRVMRYDISRAKMRHDLARVRNVPFFPFVPFVPIALVGGLLALEAFLVTRVRKLTRSVDALTARSGRA